MTQKPTGNKDKNKEIGLHQTKKVLSSKESSQQNEIQLTEWKTHLQIIYPIRVNIQENKQPN
jgi:hypothetical protein